MPKWVTIALAEIARLLSLFFAFLYAPVPQSHTNEAMVPLQILPLATVGLVAYLLLTAWIGSQSTRYGLVSTAAQGLVIAYGIYLFLSYWRLLQ